MKNRFWIVVASGALALGVAGCTERAPSAGPVATTTTLPGTAPQAAPPAITVTTLKPSVTTTMPGVVTTTLPLLGDAQKKATDLFSSARDTVVQQKDQAVEKMKGELSDLSKRVSDLGARAEARGGQVQEEYQKLKPQLDQYVADLTTKVDQAKTAGSDSWAGLVSGYKSTVDSLKKTLGQLEEKLK